MKIEFNSAWHNVLAKVPEQWRLAEVALCVAKQIYPELSIKRYLARLDVLSQQIAERIDPANTVEQRLHILNRYFFDEVGFSANHEQYYDPRNSFLNEVIDRKLGIPITLSILYLELAKTAGLDIHGINFPGHFLLGIEAGRRYWYIDVFNRGQSLSQDDLKILYTKAVGEQMALPLDLTVHLKPASRLAIIIRLLRNIKKIYIDSQEVALALRVIEMILSLTPDSADELRDRGMIYQHIDYSKGALADLTRYLELVPEAEERALIESMVESLQERPTLLH